MSRKQGRRRAVSRRKPAYTLSQVRDLIRKGKCWVNENALCDARIAFGWGRADIESALKALQVKDFYKSEPHRFVPDTMMDYYKARDLKGEKVYTHFYVDPQRRILVVSSFKEI